SGDLNGAYLAIDASEDEAIHRTARAEAQSSHVLLNVMDRPELCDFIAPAVVRRGPLQVAISTSGESPFLAGAVRRMVERLLGEEWGAFAGLMGDARDRLREARIPLNGQLAAYERLFGSEARELLARGETVAAAALANDVVAAAIES